MRQTDKHIQFEVEIKASPFAMFGGSTPTNDNNSTSSSNDEYQELDEEGFRLLAAALGGG